MKNTQSEKLNKRDITIKHITTLFAYLLVVWGFYRLLLQVPDPFDEALVKPLIWLVPLYFLLKKEKRIWTSVGITSKNIFPAVYLSLLLGSIFTIEALLINMLKYNGVNFSSNVTEGVFIGAIVVTAITAVTEEITFRGYIFNRLWEATDREIWSNVISSLAWTLLHAPLAIFDWQLAPTPLAIYLFLTFIFGLGAAFLFAKTKNIVAPIILHVLWAWPIILFR